MPALFARLAPGLPLLIRSGVAGGGVSGRFSRFKIAVFGVWFLGAGGPVWQLFLDKKLA
jgi:hypothetical protein